MSQITDNAEGKFELWFFRDMNDAQRLKLFSLFSFPTDEISTLGAQKLVLRRILSALISSPGKDGGQEVEAVKPICHLVWRQGRRAIDDVEDYYEVARPGDKSVDGSDPFPVFLLPASTALVERLTTTADEIWIEPNPPADPNRGQDWSETNAWGQQATKYVRADIAETLLKALQPFAKEADRFDPVENDDHFLTWGTTFTIGDLRRARSALSSSPTSREGER